MSLMDSLHEYTFIPFIMNIPGPLIQLYFCSIKGKAITGPAVGRGRRDLIQCQDSGPLLNKHSTMSRVDGHS